MMLIAYANIRQYGNSHQVVIDTEDTYVYVQAAYVSQQVEEDLCIRRKGSFVICRNMLPENVAKIIIPAHVITGTDHTSGFFGHGKKSLMKRLLADVEACELLQHVGGRLELQDDVRNDMRVFVLTKRTHLWMPCWCIM